MSQNTETPPAYEPFWFSFYFSVQHIAVTAHQYLFSLAADTAGLLRTCYCLQDVIVQSVDAHIVIVIVTILSVDCPLQTYNHIQIRPRSAFYWWIGQMHLTFQFKKIISKVRLFYQLHQWSQENVPSAGGHRYELRLCWRKTGSWLDSQRKLPFLTEQELKGRPHWEQ